MVKESIVEVSSLSGESGIDEGSTTSKAGGEDGEGREGQLPVER